MKKGFAPLGDIRNLQVALGRRVRLDISLPSSILPRWRQGAYMSVIAAGLFLSSLQADFARPEAPAAPTQEAAPAVRQNEAPVASIAVAPVAIAEPPQEAPRPAPAEVGTRVELSTRGYASRPRTVVIDPGHGGSESGAVSKYSDGREMREKDLNLTVSLLAADFLREQGYTVVLTRTTDSAVNVAGKDLNGDGKVGLSDDLQARIDFANQHDADAFVSVHFNGGPSDRRGTEVFYNANHPLSAESKRLASSIYDKMIGAMRDDGHSVVERGVKKDTDATGGAPFYVLGPAGRLIARDGDMPAALGEGLFITSPAEIEMIENDGFLESLARSYADGIHEYLEGN